MALDNYVNLQSAVATWLGRPGDSNVTASVADYIALCEARLAYGSGDPTDPDATLYTAPLRIRAMEASRVIPIGAANTVASVGGTGDAITLTPDTAISSYALGQSWRFTAGASNTGAATVEISGVTPARSLVKGSGLSALAAGDIVKGQTVQLYDDGTELVLMPGTANAPLPADYLAMRALYLDTDPRNPLDYVTPTQGNLAVSALRPDQPKRYTIEGDAIRLEPEPNTTYNLVCLYYKKFGALSSATNWLLTNAPNVYLYGSLLEAAIGLGMATDQTQRYYTLFRGACNGLQGADAPDRHSGGPLTIKNDTQNP